MFWVKPSSDLITKSNFLNLIILIRLNKEIVAMVLFVSLKNT